MKQKAFHIAAGDTIEQCRNRKRCKLEHHWAEAEYAETYLDNLAYRAEVKAKVDAFNAISGNHPDHLRFTFTDNLHYGSARQFGELVEAHVAQHGKRPRYVSAHLRYTLKWLHDVELRIDIRTYPVIDTEHGHTSRRWTATAMEYRYKPRAHEKQETLLKTIELDFSEHGSDISASLKQLERLFEFMVSKSDPTRGKGLIDEPYAEEVQRMMDRAMDMFNAVEATVRLDAELFFEGYGDFKNSTEEAVVVDVVYRRSMFTAQTFWDFMRANHYFNDGAIDADIRVTDSRGLGDTPASWTLYRKDGVWRVAIRQWDGQEFDSVAADAEEVRGHVYWQMMKEIVPDNQEEAFKVSQYAADIFTMVESELAYRKG